LHAVYLTLTDNLGEKEIRQSRHVVASGGPDTRRPFFLLQFVLPFSFSKTLSAYGKYHNLI
jgi:hypothetical protein